MGFCWGILIAKRLIDYGEPAKRTATSDTRPIFRAASAGPVWKYPSLQGFETRTNACREVCPGKVTSVSTPALPLRKGIAVAAFTHVDGRECEQRLGKYRSLLPLESYCGLENEFPATNIFFVLMPGSKLVDGNQLRMTILQRAQRTESATGRRPNGLEFAAELRRIMH